MSKKNINSTAGKLSVLRQLYNHIPAHLLPKLVREHKSESHVREFSHWSQVVALLYSKICHRFGLNDLCDQMDLRSGALAAIRGASSARVRGTPEEGPSFRSPLAPLAPFTWRPDQPRLESARLPRASGLWAS